MAQSPLRENSVIAWPSILYHLLHSEFTKSETPHSVVALLLSTSQLGISAGYGRLFGPSVGYCTIVKLKEQSIYTQRILSNFIVLILFTMVLSTFVEQVKSVLKFIRAQQFFQKMPSKIPEFQNTIYLFFRLIKASIHIGA